MKTKDASIKDKSVLREQILQSAIASFRIEGIIVSKEVASATLKKIELSLGR